MYARKSFRKCTLFVKENDYRSETEKENEFSLSKKRHKIDEKHDQTFISNNDIKFFIVEPFE